MTTQFAKDAFGWGTVLWLFGYLLGIILFLFLPLSLIGWVIMPFGIAATLWVSVRRIRGDTFRYYVKTGVAWALLAVVLDYIFLVRLLKPADGYYKPDVYLYYLLALLMPVFVGWRKAVTGKTGRHGEIYI